MELLTRVDPEVTRAARNGVVYLAEWWGGGQMVHHKIAGERTGTKGVAESINEVE